MITLVKWIHVILSKRSRLFFEFPPVLFDDNSQNYWSWQCWLCITILVPLQKSLPFCFSDTTNFWSKRAYTSKCGISNYKMKTNQNHLKVIKRMIKEAWLVACVFVVWCGFNDLDMECNNLYPASVSCNSIIKMKEFKTSPFQHQKQKA